MVKKIIVEFEQDYIQEMEEKISYMIFTPRKENKRKTTNLLETDGAI